MSCYICGQPRTSGEHSPAKCFFPTDKRINLTKVDSCTIHNEDTSKDDEYVRNIIAMSIGNNPVALSHFLSNCVRSFEKSPKLLSATTKVKREVHYTESEGTPIKSTVAFQIDRERINLVMRKIAYGTFYKKHNERWNRKLNIGTEYLRFEGMQADEYGNLIKLTKSLITEPTFEGTNPEVFKFAFLQPESDDKNDEILVMVFYEGFEVWAFPQIDTTGPTL